MFVVRFIAREELVVRASAALQPQVEHTDCFLEVEGSWNTDEFDARRKLVDGNERYHFTSGANEEVIWPWLSFVA